MSEIKIESTEHHYKTHKLHFLPDEVEKIFRDKCCELLELDSKGFGLSGKLEMKLVISQLTEGSPPYSVNKWNSHIEITERVDV